MIFTFETVKEIVAECKSNPAKCGIQTGFSNKITTIEEIASKIENRSFPIDGYYIHYGKGEYDWLYIMPSGYVFKLEEGVDKNKNLRWTVVHTSEKQIFSYVNINNDTIEFGNANIDHLTGLVNTTTNNTSTGVDMPDADISATANTSTTESTFAEPVIITDIPEFDNTNKVCGWIFSNVEKSDINFAKGRPTFANSNEGDDCNRPREAVDGDEFTRWSSNRYDIGPSAKHPHYIIVDMEQIREVKKIVIDIKGFDSWKQIFKVYLSKDLKNWKLVGKQDTPKTGVFNITLNDKIKARYVKFASEFSGDNGQVNVYEISVYGDYQPTVNQSEMVHENTNNVTSASGSKLQPL